MSNVRPLRPDPPSALPRVMARFVGAIEGIAIKDAIKLTIALPEGTPPEVLFALARARADGTQSVVLVSRNQAQRLPGTEDGSDMAMAAQVAVGLELRDELARQLLEQADRQTGEIHTGSVEDGDLPLAPVGTVVGTDPEEAGAAVDGMAAVDRREAARAAGRAIGRTRRVE